MNKDILSAKAVSATKWATITELVAKLVVPITNMILARLLSLESFGVVATATMVVSFADMFSDSGFQKYLVQHEFKEPSNKENSTNVAFWTNFSISIFLWILIFLFSEPLSALVGSKGFGNVLIVASLQLPITSFSSVQMAIYKRSFNFKTLFLVRVVSICLPFVITIPLAYMGFEYWALIIGNLSGALSNAIILTIKSDWKPRFYYNFVLLKEMLSFSIWSLLESLSVWLVAWVDVFIVGNYLNDYYLGIYKQSINIVNSIIYIVTVPTMSVLFPLLSRFQYDEERFKNTYWSMQKMVSYILLPMGVGILLYREVITNILLGSKWSEASDVIGIWGVITCIVAVLSYYTSEAFRAKGLPKLSFCIQVITILVLVPTCIVSVRYGFKSLVYARTLSRLITPIAGLVAMQYFLDISILKTLNKLVIPTVCTLIMTTVALFLRQIGSFFLWNIVSMVLCTIVYLIVVFIFSRDDILYLYNKFIKKGESKNE